MIAGAADASLNHVAGSAMLTLAEMSGAGAASVRNVAGCARMAAALIEGAGVWIVPIHVAGCVTVADVPAEPSAPGWKLPGLVRTEPGWLLNGTAG